MMASNASYVVFEDMFAASYKIGLTKATFFSYIVPPFVCQYLMGVLVQLEGTRFYRLALLPITVWLAWRATFVDMSGGDSAHVQTNSILIIQMCSILTRTATWVFAHVQYRRYSPVDSRDSDTSNAVNIYTACWNTWDLLLNPRGIGWNWPRGLVLPKPLFATDGRAAFVLVSITSVVLNALAFDVCVQSIRAMSPETFGSLEGGPLFDGALPPALALARGVLVASLAAWSAYFGLQYTHQLLAVVGVVVFRQHPSQWPPLFDAPWRSSSVGELWGRRWHQMMRDMVLTLGGQPLNCVFGRLGGLLGAFLVSGIFHDIELRSAGHGGNSFVMIRFWVMNGVGIVLERVWKRVTGRGVGGMWGRAWLVVWLLTWGLPLVNAYANAGRFGALCLLGRFEPGRAFVAFVCQQTREAVNQFFLIHYYNLKMTTQASLFALSQKVALTRTTFLANILPPFVCQYLMGVLIQLEGTRFYRIALLPIIVCLAWRGAFVDMSGGDPKQGQMNTMLITQMCSIPMRSTVWAMAREPFYRSNPSKKLDRSNAHSIYTALWNAWDLIWNVRGIGWNWPRGLIVPKPAFETDSRITFALWSAAQLVIHAVGFDACIQTIRALSPDTFGSLDGGSLFDNTLPPLLEILRSVFVGFLTVWMTYFAIQWSYYLLAILCTILFQNHPSQWPPLFDSPWLSTSLSELWGRRWHQMMRELLMPLGFAPFNYLFGQLGGLFGAFLVSGIFHDIELRSFGRGGNSLVVIGFWVMSSVGVVLERVWKRYTGRPVGGTLGRVWTFSWMALWGIPVANEWAKAGRFGALSLPGELAPSLAVMRLYGRL